MSQERKIKTENNIPYVHVANGRIVYRPYIKKSELHNVSEVDKGGFLKPPISLGKVGEHPDVIMKNYLAAKSQIAGEHKLIKKNTLGYIIKKYENSSCYLELAVSSQIRNKNLRKILVNFPIKINGIQDTLQNLPASNISKQLFRKIADKRLKNYRKNGKEGRVQVNREITFISSALSWATESLEDIPFKQNPLLKFKKFKEPENDVYVTDEQYDTQYEEAENIADYLQPVFELTYLVASRGIETLDIKLSDCLEEGILVRRRKGSIDNIIEWSDRLKAAYDAALLRHKEFDVLPEDPYLIIGSSGGQLPKSTLDSAMQRLNKHMKKEGKGDKRWTMHNLKSKGITDSEDKHIGGHKTEAMRIKYQKLIKMHKAVK